MTDLWVFLTAGTGPGECQIAVANLTAILCQEARAKNIKATLIKDQEGPHGLLSALVALEGDDLEAFAASWEGTIQWTCPSPIRKNWPRKNWFVSISVIRPPASAAQFLETDLRFESFRSSGPGGQHVQKTNSAVRVTHVPTGTVAEAQEERSQYRNKALAVAKLVNIFERRRQDSHAAVETDIWSRHYQLVRGNPIRKFEGTTFIP
jgi:peptide chain release factor